MQSNRLSGVLRRLSALNVALLFLVAAFAPALTSVLMANKVSALTNNVVLNEIFASPDGGDNEWVELYNPTAAPIDISGWTIKDAGSYQQVLSGIVPANGYAIVDVDQFNDDGDTITLSDGVAYSDVIAYPAIANTKSYARVIDGSETWEIRDAAQVTKNATNAIVAPAPVEPVLNAEEFVAHSSSTYKGISVGFNAKNFGTVTSVTVKVERSDGTVVTKTGNQGLFDLISNKTDSQQLTAPIVIQEGTFKETDDLLYWNPAPAEWTLTTVPVKVTINVTDENGSKTVVNEDFKQGGSWPVYFSLLPKLTFTQKVSGNTTPVETQTGWMFNRDTSTSTPFEFNDDESSVGNGSLYVKPIGANPSDKFVAEHFVFVPLLALDSVSYDFKIGATGQASDAQQFYMNVYANFGSSSATKFYDCRYSVVAQVGSTTDFTKVTFDPIQSYPVKKGTNSPHECPSVPADMADVEMSSIVRAVAINVGDTTANDQGVNGYIDNVAVDYKVVELVYDFEPKAVAPPNEDDEEDDDENSGGDNTGNGGGAGSGSSESAGDSEITVTVVSTANEFNGTRADQNIDDSDTPTSSDDEVDSDTSVLAETDDQTNQPQAEQQNQDTSPVDNQNSSTWWWILAALAVLFLIYKLLKRKKSNTEEV